jgi:hypothetical protein
METFAGEHFRIYICPVQQADVVGVVDEGEQYYQGSDDPQVDVVPKAGGATGL